MSISHSQKRLVVQCMRHKNNVPDLLTWSFIWLNRLDEKIIQSKRFI